MKRQYAFGGLVLLTAATAALAEPYDPQHDPNVNPPSLSQPAPADPSQIATDERLVRRLRADPATLNPLFMSLMHELWLKELLFDEPVVVSEQWEWMLNPAMAESYTESDDHRSAVLKLEPGLKWHDGKPLTADDVVFSFQVIRDQRVQALRPRAIVEPIADCTATNATTIRYAFKEPLATNRWSIRFPIIPRHVYEPHQTQDPTLNNSDHYTRVNRHPVGNGPYRFVEWKSGERITLERWPGYVGPKPHFARVTFRIVPDSNVALLLFKRGEIDELGLTPQQFASLAGDEAFARVGVRGWAPQATVYCIGWNMDGANPCFTDAKVRRAMGHALNLPLIIHSVYHDLFPQCRGIFPPQSWAHNPDIRLMKYDLKQAGTLLDDAGWCIDPNDGWRYKTISKADGKEERVRFAFTFSYAQESKTSPQVAAVLQQDLKRLGVEMKPRAFEATTLRQRIYERNYEAVAWAWVAEPEPDDARHLLHSEARTTGRNFAGYASPKVDALFDRARHGFDRHERAQCYRQIAQIAYDDAPYTFMINAPTLWAFHQRLRGVRFSPLGPFAFYPGTRAWWVPVREPARTPMPNR